MKKLCMFLLALFVMMGCVPSAKAVAQTAEGTEDTVKIVYDAKVYVECVINKVSYRVWKQRKYATAVWGAAEGSVLEIPSSVTLNGVQYPVTEFSNEIGVCETLDEDYDWRRDYEEIKLPESVTKVELFGNICKKITIPKHAEVFFDLDIDNISITIPEDHDYYVLKDGFIYDKKDTAKIHYVLGLNGDVHIPKGTKYVGSLLQNSKIKTLFLPSTLEEIGTKFAAFTSMKTVDLSATKLRTIPKRAFMLADLQKIKFPRTLTEIGDNAFYNTNLKKVVIPNKVTRIGLRAFSSCSQLKKVTLGKRVKRFGIYAFEYTAIKEISFPASVKRINAGVFRGTKSLRKVTLMHKKKLPRYIEYIGNTKAVYYVKNKKMQSSLKKKFKENEIKKCRIKIKS